MTAMSLDSRDTTPQHEQVATESILAATPAKITVEQTTNIPVAIKPERTPPATTPVTPSPASIKPHVPASVASPTTSNSTSFGRVAEDGTVFVRTPDGERKVGSYPAAIHEEALAYFARKYDELATLATLLLQRVTQIGLSIHDGHERLHTLREQVGAAHVVGDLAQLDATIEQITTALKAKEQVEGNARAAARAKSAAKRETLVAEVEKITAQAVEKVQWKQSTARMHTLLDEWKTLQRNDIKLDKSTENALWQRFSTARNGFDQTRRTHFAKLDEEYATIKQTKQQLIVEAEKIATSKNWAQTASIFKRLMSEWKRAGRISRVEDDALWAKFKAAQDAFFNAKGAIVVEENKQFAANLALKEELLKEAQAMLPIKNIGRTKAALRTIQDKWNVAGKVPRKDMDRIEKTMRKIENAVRDAESAKWKRTDTELATRAQSMVEQLEKIVADLQVDLDKVQVAGNDKKANELQASLEARQAWLKQARSGLKDFGN